MKVNRIAPALLALGLLSAAPAFAQNHAVKVSVDNAPVPFAGQQPVNEQGHILVPLRGVFEKMGAKVAYDAASRTVMARSDKSSVGLTVGSTQATVDGKPMTLDAPTKITNGAVLVPLRFVSESLGSAVRFDRASQTVLVDTSKTPAPSLGAADNAAASAAPSQGDAEPAPTASVPQVQAAPVAASPVPVAAQPAPQAPVAAAAPADPAPTAPPVVTQPAPQAPVVVTPVPVAAGPGVGQILPYVLGALILLGLVAWFLNRRGKTGQVIAADEKTLR